MRHLFITTIAILFSIPTFSQFKYVPKDVSDAPDFIKNGRLVVN
ncbi:hypothetical protein N9J52_01585 [Flavobacteriales bacterium]|nr:hypothetical protein [Flavobacteriales bacterium]